MAVMGKIVTALVGLTGATASGTEAEARGVTRQSAVWKNDTAVATNTAISERSVSSARQKCKLVKVSLICDAAVTGTATDFFTLLIRKRPVSAPGTPVTLITFAADTPTTDNCTAFAEKDLLAAATFATYVTGTGATDFDFEEGDVVTAEITKSTATGMTFPVASLKLDFEPRT